MENLGAGGVSWFLVFACPDNVGGSTAALLGFAFSGVLEVHGMC